MTHFTKKGLFYRKDRNLGILVYSPYTGLFFACKEVKSTEEELLSWLNGDSHRAPSGDYEKSIGSGWFIPISESDYPSKHLLSASNKKWETDCPEKPILINWFLTGKCSLRCTYCYAQDLMHGKCREPNKTDIKKIASSILSYNPLAVVLTGGDPLCSPYLEEAIKCLHRKTGIILDTNGYNMTNQQIALFKRYSVFVRVSLDSEIPSVNAKLRPIPQEDNCSLVAAVESINKCMKSKIPLGIQTVVTKINYSDLESLGDKLYRIGIRSWRLMELADFIGFENYNNLLGKCNRKRFSESIKEQLRTKHRNGWNKGMAVQFSHNSTSNAVILVSPEGDFLTEQLKTGGKLQIDTKSPQKPSMEMLIKKVNMFAHAERYLGS